LKYYTPRVMLSVEASLTDSSKGINNESYMFIDKKSINLDLLLIIDDSSKG
jgi:hypothetical protein